MTDTETQGLLGLLLLASIAAFLFIDRARRRAEFDRLADAIARARADLVESQSALLRAFEGFLPELRDALARSSSASESVSRAAERLSDAPSIGLVTEELLQRLPGPVFLAQGFRQNELIALVEKIANDVSAMSSPAALEERLKRMTESNYRLLNDGDMSILENYVRSEMALSALLYSIEDDVSLSPQEELKEYLKPSVLERVLKTWNKYRIGEKLLGKVNDLAKAALGVGKG